MVSSGDVFCQALCINSGFLQGLNSLRLAASDGLTAFHLLMTFPSLEAAPSTALELHAQHRLTPFIITRTGLGGSARNLL